MRTSKVDNLRGCHSNIIQRTRLKKESLSGWVYRKSNKSKFQIWPSKTLTQPISRMLQKCNLRLVSSRSLGSCQGATQVYWAGNHLELDLCEGSRKLYRADLCSKWMAALQIMLQWLFHRPCSDPNLPRLTLLVHSKRDISTSQRSHFRRQFRNKKWVLAPMLVSLPIGMLSMQFRGLRWLSVSIQYWGWVLVKTRQVSKQIWTWEVR